MLRIINLLKYLGLLTLLSTTNCYALPATLCQANAQGKLNNSTVEFFANLTINSLFSFNFVNYRTQLLSRTDLLNSKAWSQYNSYVNKLNLLKNVIDKKQIVSTYFKTPATVLSVDDKGWQINVPFILTTQSAANQNSMTINATMTIKQNNKQTANCGLRVSSIQFNPEIQTSFFKRFFGLDSITIPYQEGIAKQTEEEFQDLKQPLMDDTAIITAANTWILKQNRNPSLLNSPLVITQKGILRDKYSWRIQLNGASLLVQRSTNPPYGLDFMLSN